MFARLENDGIPIIFPPRYIPNDRGTVDVRPPADHREGGDGVPAPENGFGTTSLTPGRSIAYRLFASTRTSGAMSRRSSTDPIRSGKPCSSSTSGDRRSTSSSRRTGPVTRPQDNIDHLRGLNKFAKDHNLPGIPEGRDRRHHQPRRLRHLRRRLRGCETCRLVENVADAACEPGKTSPPSKTSPSPRTVTVPSCE